MTNSAAHAGAWDADGHIYEWEGTFAEEFWDSRFADERPRVIDIDGTGDLVWYIDGRLFPIRHGPNQRHGGTPASMGGVPSPKQTRKPQDPVESAELRSSAPRLAQNAAENIALQVNFPTMLLSWPLAYRPGLGGAVARSYNSWIAAVSGQAPDKLKWVTCIDCEDSAEAAREIYRTKELGSAGVMVFGLANNRHLDDPWYEPVWRACNETGLPLAVHPSFSCPAIDNLYENSTDLLTVAFVFPVLMAFARICSRGLLDRYPNVKVGFMESGCQWLPFMMERIEENSPAASRVTTNRDASLPALNFRAPSSGSYQGKLSPEDYIRRGQVYVSFEVNEELLPFMVEHLGDDFLLYASDIPHAHRLHMAADHLWARPDLSETSKRKLLIDNTARFYGFDIPVSGVPTQQLKVTA